MPFTPFHLGPALCLGIPLRRFIHAPTFILANVALDVEPLLVMVLGLNYPLHGYFHTFLAAIGIGAILGLTMLFLERPLQPFYRTLLLETETPPKRLQFAAGGILGTVLHVMFDAPLYADIRPFYPLTANPLFGAVSSLEVYLLCFWMGILGAAFYSLILIAKALKKPREIQAKAAPN